MYKVTGDATYKTAYQSAQKAIQGTLDASQTALTDDARAIRDFLATYEGNNPTLMKLREESQKIQKDGPALQDRYAAIKKLSQDQNPAVDIHIPTNYYVKGLVVGGLVLIAALVRTL